MPPYGTSPCGTVTPLRQAPLNQWLLRKDVGAIKTIHNESKKRFDLYDEAGKHLGEIEYMHGGNNTLYATHTKVFPGGEGKGYATRLLDALVEYATAREAKIVPICSFVKASFAKWPEKYAAVIV